MSQRKKREDVHADSETRASIPQVQPQGRAVVLFVGDDAFTMLAELATRRRGILSSRMSERYFGVTLNSPPGFASSIIHKAPSGPTATSRIR
jgi:hypothetical protein